MFRKLSTRISVVLILVIGVIFTLFTIYLVKERTRQLNEMLLDKAITSAQTGAKIMGSFLDMVIKEKVFTESQVFDGELVPIDLPPTIKEAYLKQGVTPTELEAIQKYNYKSGFDTYLDTLVSPIQNEFFMDDQVVFAVLCDNQGYTPIHNIIYNNPLTGDYASDLERSRSKRVYYDEVVASDIYNRYIKQVYHRDTGEEVWKITSPVFVNGTHWGSFRIGFSKERTATAIAQLRQELIIMMAILLIISVIVINRITAFLMKPLKQLHEGVEKVSKGDLSFDQKVKSADEIGDLASAFTRMTHDLNDYIKDLKDTTAAKERFESELKVGTEIQSSMLPRTFPPFPDRFEFEIFATMEPAREVGGDFYDFFLVGEKKFCFVVGDVSGKGVPAALFMVITKTLIHSEASRGLPLNEVLENVNQILSQNNNASMFVTVCCGILDLESGELELCNGGHDSPLLKSITGKVVHIPTKQNIALGILDSMKFKSDYMQVYPSDTLILYTDGVTEAENREQELFSENRLEETVVEFQSNNLKEIVSNIRSNIKEFAAGADQSDDITILAITYHGKQLKPTRNDQEEQEQDCSNQ